MRQGKRRHRLKRLREKCRLWALVFAASSVVLGCGETASDAVGVGPTVDRERLAQLIDESALEVLAVDYESENFGQLDFVVSNWAGNRVGLAFRPNATGIVEQKTYEDTDCISSTHYIGEVSEGFLQRRLGEIYQQQPADIVSLIAVLREIVLIGNPGEQFVFVLGCGYESNFDVGYLHADGSFERHQVHNFSRPEGEWAPEWVQVHELPHGVVGETRISVLVRDLQEQTVAEVEGPILTYRDNAAPVYEGGLSDARCAHGETISVGPARFSDADGDTVSVSYTLQGVRENGYTCQAKENRQVIEYNAKGYDGWGGRTVSPSVQLIICAANEPLDEQRNCVAVGQE